MQGNIASLFPDCSKCQEYYAKYTWDQVRESIEYQNLLLGKYQIRKEEASKEDRPTTVSRNEILVEFTNFSPKGIPVSPFVIHEMHCNQNMKANLLNN